MAQKPLMLKDFLELDSNSESCAEFRCATRRPPDAATMRCLLEAELGSGNSGSRLLRTRSRKAITKLSAVVNVLRLLRISSPSAESPAGILPRSLSKKLRKSLWSKRGEREEVVKKIRVKEVRVRDIVRLGSFIERSSFDCPSPSPVVSNCSSWSDSSSCSGSDLVRSSTGSSQCSESKKNSPPGTPSPSPSPNPNPKAWKGVGVETAARTATSHRAAKEVENEGLECAGCHSEEEKEQLSPVSVMDFPYQDEEEEEEEQGEEDQVAISASFHHSLASIERTTHQLLQKIRRFESLAQLDPVDLEKSFASAEELLESSDHVGSADVAEEIAAAEEGEALGRRAREILKRLSAQSLEQHIESLLLDFFAEELSCRGSNKDSSLRWSACMDEEQPLLNAARDWMNGRNSRADNGEMCLKEMEGNGRWRSFEEEEGELEVSVEAGVLGWLLEELALDLLAT